VALSFFCMSLKSTASNLAQTLLQPGGAVIARDPTGRRPNSSPTAHHFVNTSPLGDRRSAHANSVWVCAGECQDTPKENEKENAASPPLLLWHRRQSMALVTTAWRASGTAVAQDATVWRQPRPLQSRNVPFGMLQRLAQASVSQDQ